jgi:hypothetical protein
MPASTDRRSAGKQQSAIAAPLRPTGEPRAGCRPCPLARERKSPVRLLVIANRVDGKPFGEGRSPWPNGDRYRRASGTAWLSLSDKSNMNVRRSRAPRALLRVRAGPRPRAPSALRGEEGGRVGSRAGPCSRAGASLSRAVGITPVIARNPRTPYVRRRAGAAAMLIGAARVPHWCAVVDRRERQLPDVDSLVRGSGAGVRLACRGKRRGCAGWY